MPRFAVILAVLVFTGTAEAKAPPAGAPVRDCRDRITGAVVIQGGETTPAAFVVRPAHDTTFRAISFTGLADYGKPATWVDMVRRDQWLKSVALVRPGARVTLVVPTPQRAWMRMEYGHGRGAYELTLAGCRRFASSARQRAECGPGPQDTCTSGRTPFSGGFTIDYARAPRQGRCAELIVWVDGRAAPLRKRIFPEACRSAPAA